MDVDPVQAAYEDLMEAIVEVCEKTNTEEQARIAKLELSLDEAEKLIQKNADQINGLLAQVAALKEIAEGGACGRARLLNI